MISFSLFGLAYNLPGTLIYVKELLFAFGLLLFTCSLVIMIVSCLKKNTENIYNDPVTIIPKGYYY